MVSKMMIYHGSSDIVETPEIRIAKFKTKKIRLKTNNYAYPFSYDKTNPIGECERFENFLDRSVEESEEKLVWK